MMAPGSSPSQCAEREEKLLRVAALIQQMKDFPVGDHDDGPDALEMALRLMIELWNGRFTPAVSRLTL
jgi:hypothetical protein